MGLHYCRLTQGAGDEFNCVRTFEALFGDRLMAFLGAGVKLIGKTSLELEGSATRPSRLPLIKAPRSERGDRWRWHSWSDQRQHGDFLSRRRWDTGERRTHTGPGTSEPEDLLRVIGGSVLKLRECAKGKRIAVQRDSRGEFDDGTDVEEG